MTLRKNVDNNELCDTIINESINALQLNQFNNIGLNQIVNHFIAQEANRYSINHYDHTVVRSMEDSSYQTDPAYNS